MKNLILFSKIIAALSFILGTCLLSLYLYFNSSTKLITIGFIYVIIALILNSVLFTVNFIGMVTNKTYRLELLKTCGIQLINIPVAVLYFYLIIEFTTPRL